LIRQFEVVLETEMGLGNATWKWDGNKRDTAGHLVKKHQKADRQISIARPCVCIGCTTVQSVANPRQTRYAAFPADIS